ncbi:MAG: YifB family Mg chelatase-like AAA ATPase [Treponema sp.]|jgi:magnesium chelatase family protein|nr:YifB family Mg chelatase-like AAA ATPase [Treponema sp.]
MYVTAYAPYGADGIIIRVEADIRRGIPGIDITGLAEGAVREARERVRAAFRNSGFPFPPDRILINLAPAGVRKDEASLDLPIALSVMAAAGMVPALDELMVLGELELSGRLRPVRGVLAATAAGIRAGIRDFIVPAENAREAAILARGRFAAAASLAEAVHALFVRAETGSLPGADLGDPPPPGGPARSAGDFSQVRSQGRYKRALEIAAAGGHNLLVFGPPGAGKTMLARRMPSIMAPLETWEAVEVTRLYSLAGQIRTGPPNSGLEEAGPDAPAPESAGQSGDSLNGGAPLSAGGCLITQPPFRSPHHSASAQGILGGGKTVRPGEISLAHFGVLFMDEAPEFRVNVLQALREPLEDRVVTISRAEGPVRLPAEFQLLLAANPCPCGRLGMVPEGPSPEGGNPCGGGCLCTAEEIHRYWRKLGGALLDRVELRVAVKSPRIAEMGQGEEEPSAAVRCRVIRAAEIQRERFKGTAIRRNARMTTDMISRHCHLSREAEGAFHGAAEKLGLSGRAFYGALRTARTIADLEDKETILPVHILEAVQHRRLGEDPYEILSV